MLIDPIDAAETAKKSVDEQRVLQASVVSLLGRWAETGMSSDDAAEDISPLQFMLVAEHELILRRETNLAYARGEEHCEVVFEHESDWRVEQAQRILTAVERLRANGESGMDLQPGESAFTRALDLIKEAAEV